MLWSNLHDDRSCKPRAGARPNNGPCYPVLIAPSHAPGLHSSFETVKTPSGLRRLAPGRKNVSSPPPPIACNRDVSEMPRPPSLVTKRAYLARFQTNSTFSPDGVVGLVNFSSSDVSEVMSRFCSSPPIMFAKVLPSILRVITLSDSVTVYVP
jgi:hypothetical protein